MEAGWIGSDRRGIEQRLHSVERTRLDFDAGQPARPQRHEHPAAYGEIGV